MKRLAFITAAFAMLGAGALADPIAITGGKVWTGTADGTIENGVVVIDNGQIVRVGPADTDYPATSTLIDASGKWVTPGIIAPFSRIGLVEVGAEDSTNDTSASGSDYSVAIRASDGFNPSATTIDVTRIEGITRVVVAPNPTGNIFAGQGFIADTTGAPDTDIRKQAFLLISLGERGAGLSGGSRPAAWAQLRAAFDDARNPGRYMGGNNEGTALNRVDALALSPALRGRQVILIEAHRASDLLKIIELAADYRNLKIAIVGADEGWVIADELAESQIPVIVDPFQNLPATFEQLGATSQNAKRMIDAGVQVAFAHLSDDGHQARLGLQVAGNAVANGVAHDDALAALTLVPSRIFGLRDFGTLERGKMGDVVVWDGDPLEVTSSPESVIIAGELQSLESRQTRLRDRYLTLDEGSRPKAYDRP